MPAALNMRSFRPYGFDGFVLSPSVICSSAAGT